MSEFQKDSKKLPLKAVIVGATGGIGQAVCRLLAESGGEAFLIGRSSEKLNELAGCYGWGCAVADAADWSQLDSAMSGAEGECRDQFGRFGPA